MAFDYPHLTRYTRPKDFADFADIDRNQYYVIGGQHRDSDTLTRANHTAILKALGGESETVLVLRDSHWAVGWVEAIYIHESDHAALTIADQIAENLEDYPVVDETAWSDLEYETAVDCWEHMSVRERMDWCKRYDCSIFAARRAEIPEDRSGELISALAE
jgi:hypothetical protein